MRTSALLVVLTQTKNSTTLGGYVLWDIFIAEAFLPIGFASFTSDYFIFILYIRGLTKNTPLNALSGSILVNKFILGDS